MIIYNVTVKLEPAIAGDYIKWMQQEHIPEVVGTGCFTHAHILRLLETDESDGPTYAIQYHAESKSNYNRYMEKHAGAMRQKLVDRWGNRVIAFRTVMQRVD